VIARDNSGPAVARVGGRREGAHADSGPEGICNGGQRNTHAGDGGGRGSGPGLRREEAGDSAYDLAMSNIRPEQREGDEQQREERE